MQPDRTEDPAQDAAVCRRLAWVVAALGIASIAVPDTGRALGVDVDVDRSVEIVDHVVPGLATVVAALVLWMSAERFGVQLAAWGAVLLAGLWVTVSHIPLVADAGQGVVGWPDALFHATLGAPILLIGLWQFAILVRGA